MKRLVFSLAMVVATTVFAETAWVHRDPPHVEWFGKPSYVDVQDLGRVWNPPAEICLADGWESFEYGGRPDDAVWDPAAPVAVRDMTQQELDARQADCDAEQAERDRQAALPTVYTNGVEVPWVVFLDSTNREKGIAMELTTNNVPIYYEFHASPVDWVKVHSNRAAAMSKWVARIQAVKNAKSQGGGLAALAKRVAALEAMHGVE